MAGPLTRALDQLDEFMNARPFDAGAVRSAFYGVQKVIGSAPAVDDLSRMLEACMFALDIGAERRPAIAEESQARSLAWAVKACLHDVIFDQQRESRLYSQRSITRHLGIGLPPYEGEPTVSVPIMHIALPEAQAAELIAPYLDHLEAQLSDDPYSHLKLCWDVFESPVPPFHTVFDRWLAEVDVRRGSNDLPSIRRAMALVRLAREGTQRLSWSDCEQYLLPQLSDPHPLVAAAAGRYLGVLFSDPKEMIVHSTAPSVVQVMAQIAALPENRRFVAGGFLNGYDDLSPFEAMREDKAFKDMDLAAWVMAVLDDRTPEPYLPSAQSFWFYVHEEFCFDPVFINRMIDADHLWEALMTATEMQQEVEGMRPVLQRLADCSAPGIATCAQHCLEQHYSAPQ